jgi:hypothetical protein
VNRRLKRAWHVPDAGDQDENPAWKPKLKDWQPAIEDYLCGWDLSDADIDTVCSCGARSIRFCGANTCGWRLRSVVGVG